MGVKSRAQGPTLQIYYCVCNSLQPFGYQLCHDAWIGKGRGITQFIDSILGDLSQNSSHDLTASGLWQAIRKLEFVRRGDGTDNGSDMVHKLFLQVVALLYSRFQGNKGVDALSLDVMGVSNDGCLCDSRMGDESAFHLSGPDTVAGDVDDVVDSTQEPVISIRILPRPVTGEIISREHGEVGLLESLIVLIVPEPSAACQATAA